MQQQLETCSEEMQELRSVMPLGQDLQNDQYQQIPNPQIQVQGSQEDFFEQLVLSSLPSWPELPGNPKPSYDLNPNNHKLFSIPTGHSKPRDMDILEDQSPSNHPENHHYPYDDSTLLASRLRQHQITGNSSGGKPMMLQQHLLLSRGLAGGGMARSPTSGSGGTAPFVGDSGLLSLPLSLATNGDDLNGLTGSLPQATQALNQQHFNQPQNYGASITGMNQSPAKGVSGGVNHPVRQKVRARRGHATDPHSIAERLRRERIAERMKSLQELVPNANKTDKASMLDEIIDYVKFLQLQVKVLSMSRLGGAATVAPLVASSEGGGGDCIHGNGNGRETAPINDSLSATEQQVAKLLEEDMGSAMQYLQGKGLCLMPISLATAISTSTITRNTTTSHHHHHHNPFLSSNVEGPSSPSMSVLTVQSATMANGVGGETSIKDVTSVSKP